MLHTTRNRSIALGLVTLGIVLSGTAVTSAANGSFGAFLQAKFFAPQAKNEVWRTHFCGNGRIENREQCDDNNKTSGDGCSRVCRKEKNSSSSRSSSQSSTSSTQKKCLSSSQCAAGQYCTTADGDCLSACEPARGGRAPVCIQACAGICKKQVTLPPIRSSNSSSVAMPDTSCIREKKNIDAAASLNSGCRTTADCMLFQRGCPYVTCGVAINKNGESTVQAEVDAYLRCKVKSSGMACAKCTTPNVACVNNRCITR